MIECRVYGETYRHAAPRCSDGTESVIIEAKPAPEYVGAPADAAAYLERRGVDGRGVEVRYYRAGQFTGLRSCMNKPALWADLRAMGA